jgi:hypothetical protein
MSHLKENLPAMFIAGMTLLVGALVVDSFEVPAFWAVSIAGLGAVFLLAAFMLANWFAGRDASAGELMMLPENRVSIILPCVSMLLYLGVLALVGGHVTWSVKQIGIVGLFVAWASQFLAALYLTFCGNRWSPRLNGGLGPR